MRYEQGRWITHRTARRSRRCDTCGRRIKVGDNYLEWRYPPNWDGMGNPGWSVYRTHDRPMSGTCPDEVAA